MSMKNFITLNAPVSFTLAVIGVVLAGVWFGWHAVVVVLLVANNIKINGENI